MRYHGSMKQFLAFILLILLVSGAYLFYKIYTSPSPTKLTNPTLGSRMVINQSGGNLSNLKNILGTATSRIWNTGTELLNNASGGTAEPIINKAVEDLQTRVKELPQEQYDRVKYEFCKDVFPSPSPAIVEDSP